jgi:catechol 2,3-dioxygenase-like lactoylglutathione lyase family enzyme
MVPHHVGCAVRDLEAAFAAYSGALGLKRRTPPVRVESQRVEVCFLELGPGFFVELISPLAGNSGLDRYLAAGFYHLCFLVPDLEASRARMKANRFVVLPEFESEAFGGKPCQFFLSPQAQLIELCEMESAEFDALFEATCVT